MYQHLHTCWPISIFVIVVSRLPEPVMEVKYLYFYLWVFIFIKGLPTYRFNILPVLILIKGDGKSGFNTNFNFINSREQQYLSLKILVSST